MSENLTEKLYAKITAELKKITKKQAIDLGINYRDYLTLALQHYADHIDAGDFEKNLIEGE